MLGEIDALLDGPPRMEIRQSWIREALSGDSRPRLPGDNASVVDEHMQRWVNAGWSLRSASTTVSPGVALVGLLHTFVWERTVLPPRG